MNRAAPMRAVLVLALSLGFSMMIADGVRADGHDAAKAAGWVGERADGYLGIVDSAAPGAIKALVANINGKRRAQYQRIADRDGTSLQTVEAIVGNKLVERAKPGQSVMDAAGRWVVK